MYADETFVLGVDNWEMGKILQILFMNFQVA
jgi:hypothetical protein